MPNDTDPREPDVESSDPSIAALQRNIRRLNWLMAFTLVLMLLTFLKTIESRTRKREIILVDAGGVPRAVLGTRNDTPFLSMFDADGQARIAIGIEADGPMLRLSNPGSTTHAGVWLKPGGARLALVNTDGSGIQLHSDERDARIHFQDHTGWPRLGLGIDDGAPFIGLMETNLIPRIIMGTDRQGGRLSFFGEESMRRLSLGVHENRPFLNPIRDPQNHSSPETDNARGVTATE